MDDTTFVPVRAVSQALDANVVWDDELSTISIFSDSSAANSDNKPTVTMYAPDGRTIDVTQSEVEAYENVGWYTEPYTLPKTNSSSSGSSSSDSSGSSSSSGVVRGSTVYVTPSGEKYHYSASCAGKNARATTLSAAQASGKGPCSKCAR